MKPHPRIRKTAKWGGAVVCLVLIAAWVGSRWWVIAWSTPNDIVAVISGGILAETSIPNAEQRPPGPIVERHRQQYYTTWWIEWERSRTGWYGEVPLWFFLLPALLITAAAWRFDTLARRRAVTGMCVKCRYDRTGLAAGAVCPECGAAAPRSV